MGETGTGADLARAWRGPALLAAFERVFFPGEKIHTGEKSTDPVVRRPPEKFEWIFSPVQFLGVVQDF